MPRYLFFFLTSALFASSPIACVAQKTIGADQACDPTAAEACDGVDNDCDGEVDEGVAGTGIACETGLADGCANGITTCEAGTFSCVAINGTDEVCDGLDNDCDGQIDEEGSWTPFNEGLDGGSTTSVSFDPRYPGVAYATVGARLYRSDDAGESFSIRAEAPDKLRRLAFPIDEPEVLLATTDVGLYRSEDSGVTWHAFALDGLALWALLVHPADPARIYVGTTGGGIYRSTNGGSTFTAVNAGVPLSRTTGFSTDPADPDVVTASLILLDEQGVFGGGRLIHTTNGGNVWNIALEGVGNAQAIGQCGADGTRQYATLEGTGVAWSQDAGASWMIGGLSGAAVYGVASSATSCETVYVGSYADGVARSSDGAASFGDPSAEGMNVQLPGQLVLDVDPLDDSRLLAGNHSGVFLSDDSGDSWTRVGVIASAAPRRIAVSADEPSRAWLTTWGQGVWSRAGSDGVWEKVDSTTLPRDWAFTVAPDPTKADRVLVGAAGDLWRSDDGGATFAQTDVSENVLDLAYHPVDPSVIFAATQTAGVLISEDGGSTWVPSNEGLPAPWPSGPCTCQDVRDVLVDQDSPSTVYLATALRGFYRSGDGGATWQATAPQLADESVGCLTQRSGELFACVEGSGIWMSDDDGLTFTPVTQGDPLLSNVTGIHLDPATGELFATSDAGIFRSADGQEWEGLDNACLPGKTTTAPAILDDGTERLLLFATETSGIVALSL